MATTATDTNYASSIASAAGIATAKTSKHKTSSDLNVTDFMRLMTTQLRNQDPLKPLDSTDFVAQLAQFGTVSGVQGMQGTLAALSTALQSSQMLTGASLVGHRIQTAASAAHYPGHGTIDGLVQVPEGASSVRLTINDANGQAGAQLAPGDYQLQAVSSAGQKNESLATYLNGHVRSVSLDASGAGLTVNTVELGAISLSAVREVI
jgi:flagellar basal-body rod modification protein FlgD